MSTPESTPVFLTVGGPKQLSVLRDVLRARGVGAEVVAPPGKQSKG